MPRSPTVFNLVPGTVPQVPDTPISSAMFNAAMLDFEQTFNTPQPIQYGGTAATTAVGGFDGLNTKGANVATAATLNLDTATGAFVDLTGTTTVTAVTLSDGRHRMARATGAFQITVGASLIGNAGGSNINVEVGDLIIFEGYSAGVVRLWVVRASGKSVIQDSSSGYIFGLSLSNNITDITNDIDIAIGSATDSTGLNSMVLASALGKRLDASWAVGGTPASTVGGLDTGSIANTTYHVFLIRRPDTGVVDAIFSTSATTPTLPANYSQFRRIGSIIRVGGSIKTFIQDGDYFGWGAIAGDVQATNPGTAAVTRTLTVPTGIRVRAKTSVGVNVASTTIDNPSVILISDLSVPDATPSVNSAFTILALQTVAGGQFQAGGMVEVFTNLSAQVRSRIAASNTGTTLYIETHGYFDTRGRG